VSDEAADLKAVQERLRAQLRAALGPNGKNVNAFEGKADSAGIEAWIRGEYARFGAKPPVVDDE
jgi:hypothetical protein